MEVVLKTAAGEIFFKKSKNIVSSAEQIRL